jgi:hypothetical protein
MVGIEFVDLNISFVVDIATRAFTQRQWFPILVEIRDRLQIVVLFHLGWIVALVAFVLRRGN